MINILSIILLIVSLFTSLFAIANVCDTCSQGEAPEAHPLPENITKNYQPNRVTHRLFLMNLNLIGTVKIIVRYKIGTNTPKLSLQKHVLNQFKENQTLIQD